MQPQLPTARARSNTRRRLLLLLQCCDSLTRQLRKRQKRSCYYLMSSLIVGLTEKRSSQRRTVSDESLLRAERRPTFSNECVCALLQTCKFWCFSCLLFLRHDTSYSALCVCHTAQCSRESLDIMAKHKQQGVKCKLEHNSQANKLVRRHNHLRTLRLTHTHMSNTHTDIHDWLQTTSQRSHTQQSTQQPTNQLINWNTNKPQYCSLQICIH